MKRTSRRTDKLISIGTDPLGRVPVRFSQNFLESWGELGWQLAGFLKRNNGLYAFESALHVFPAGAEEGVMDLETWNAPATWIYEYDDMASDMLFFAEGIFADQFAIRGDEIVRFQAETGLWEPIADDLEDWASLILDDYGYQTGWRIAHEWQVEHGALLCGQRLVATTPFVCGGEYDIANLYALDAVKAMRYHGWFALQIRGLPDGTEIIIDVLE